MQILRQLDVHPKVREEADILVRTFTGAIVTIISTIIMGILFMSEINYYLTPSMNEELFVDTSRGSKLRINVDIIVPTISCDLLSIDAMDTTGEQHLDIEHNIFKRRLDLSGKPIEDPQRTSAMMFYHYIKIVPTTYVRSDGSTLFTNQFSVTRHARQVSLFTGESGMPGIFFSYELSPLMVKYTEKAKSFGHFATNTCAIIGGVFTVAGLIDSLLYHSVRAIQKKIELGKYN
ncbi:hypothetical protein ACFW04_006258 [Cataglyphis niger]